MKVSIYGHSGSSNHGNEAIVRGVKKLLNQKIDLYSFDPEVDLKFGLDEVCDIHPFFKRYKRYSIAHIFLSVWWRLTKSNKLHYKYILQEFLKKIDGLYILEAGDQYCENDNVRWLYRYLNKEINRRGGKTVMLGCTINEEFLQNKKVINDLNRYSLIIARESITYKALLKVGVDKNTYLAPDPAFSMDYEECELPSIFKSDTIGINIGFLKQGNEVHYDLMLKNCLNLVDYIISNTNYNVALIPHVNWDYNNSDFRTLDIIYDKFQHSNRIHLASEKSAPKQKYVMSKCKIMVALRTHVAIPSLASKVPTLVTGYKVKSSGIIGDIFPDEIKLLAHVSSLKSEYNYIEDFKWIDENFEMVKKYMDDNMQLYISKTDIIIDKITSIINDNSN